VLERVSRVKMIDFEEPEGGLLNRDGGSRECRGPRVYMSYRQAQPVIARHLDADTRNLDAATRTLR